MSRTCEQAVQRSDEEALVNEHIGQMRDGRWGKGDGEVWWFGVFLVGGRFDGAIIGV